VHGYSQGEIAGRTGLPLGPSRPGCAAAWGSCGSAWDDDRSR
jgi:hypothetical protein